MIYKLFGMKMKNRRKKAGMSEEELAKRLGVSRITVANMESGRQRVFLHKALDIAEILNFDINAVMVEKKIVAKFTKDSPRIVKELIEYDLDENDNN